MKNKTPIEKNQLYNGNLTILFVYTPLSIILAALVCLLLVSCGPNSKPPHDSTAVTEPIEPIRTNSTRYAVVIKIMEPVEPGLSKVLLDDSTTILIYRGTESCTMIQLK